MLEDISEEEFWVLDGPSKRKFICQVAKNFNLDVLIETGTCSGDTVEYAIPHFRKIYSIELKREWAEAAIERFKPHPKVTIGYGDSALLLPAVLSLVEVPCILWLDAHYSGHETIRGPIDCPVLLELNAVRDFAKNGSVILIDDAFMFRKETGWPTEDQLVEKIHDCCKDYDITKIANIIIAVPNGQINKVVDGIKVRMNGDGNAR